MEKVSVITISLNAAASIETTLQSIYSQTYPCIEHVIIDGGSTDGTLEIINKYRERIGYFVSEPDRGVYNAMNKGIKAATGDILFFLNADDRFYDNQVIEDVVAVFNEQPDVAIVYGNPSWELPDRIFKRKQPSMITREFLASMTIIHQTIFAKQHVFRVTGGFSEHYRIISDYEWMLKVFLKERFKYKHYDRDISIMGTQGLSWTTKWETERIQVMIKYFSPYEILKYRIWPRQKPVIENYIKTKKNYIVRTMRRSQNRT